MHDDTDNCHLSGAEGNGSNQGSNTTNSVDNATTGSINIVVRVLSVEKILGDSGTSVGEPAKTPGPVDNDGVDPDGNKKCNSHKGRQLHALTKSTTNNSNSDGSKSPLGKERLILGSFVELEIKLSRIQTKLTNTNETTLCIPISKSVTEDPPSNDSDKTIEQILVQDISRIFLLHPTILSKSKASLQRNNQDCGQNKPHGIGAIRNQLNLLLC